MLMQDSLTARRAEVRSSDELGVMCQDVVPWSELLIRATFVNLKALQTNRLTGRTRMNVHKNARSCPLSRELLVKRVCEQGWSVRAASEAVGMSDRRGREWLRRANNGNRSPIEARDLRRLRPPRVSPRECESWSCAVGGARDARFPKRRVS